MNYSNHILSQLSTTLLKSQNVKHVVISPGSRNAPLTIGFTNDPFFKCYSIVDERCAAFFALGIAQQINHPVALVCTSGSALLNYYPAVAESYYSQIPLIILSADRPKQFIGIGDGQTINQEGVFKNHILYQANLDENQSDLNNRLINEALKMAIQQKGPVHLNMPFSEPLYGISPSLEISPKTIEILPKSLISEDLSRWRYLYNKSKKKLVLLGVCKPETFSEEAINYLAKDPSVLVMTETTSNVHHPNFIYGIDNLIAPLTDLEFQDLKPDIVITLGGLIVSKKIKAFLRKYKPQHHWHVGLTKANNTFFALEKHFEYNVNVFFKEFINEFEFSESDYRKHWLTVFNYRKLRHKKYLESLEFCDLKVYDMLLKHIPNDNSLQISNSTAIRYSQLFKMNPSVSVFCNRGTSGIDGSTSTAVGASVVNSLPTLLITGDLSFFYDSNAFWNNFIPNTFRVIVINNSGGGIFRILPGNKDEAYYDTFFETTHNLNASNLCEMHGFEYFSVSTITELENNLQTFFNPSKKPQLLEVFTPKNLNDKFLLEYLKYLA